MGWTKVSYPEAIKILNFIDSVNKKKNQVYFNAGNLQKAKVSVEYSSKENAFVIQLYIVATWGADMDDRRNELLGVHEKAIFKKHTYSAILRL